MTTPQPEPGPWSDDLANWNMACMKCLWHRANYMRWLEDPASMRGRGKAWCDRCGAWVRS
jgi:hypothetical protein